MKLYRWTSDALLTATGGIWHNLTDDITTTHITTDTRKINLGDVFVALKGDNFDGHDFIDVAIQKGAAAVIVSCQIDADIPQLLVDDTRLALGKLGQYRRDMHPDLTVVALTGSSGKTTTKEMLGAILNQIAPTLITKGNLNNDLGVPMMLLELSDEHKFAVLELGANHMGEIVYTADLVRPDVACVLNIGTAHLGEFGGQDNIAKTKAEIFSALRSDGVAILPFGDKYFDFLNQEAQKFTENLITFGEKSMPTAQAVDLDALSPEEQAEFANLDSVLVMGDVFADDVVLHRTYSDFELVCNFQVDEIDSTLIHLPFIGEHNITNALAASSCAVALGVPLETIKQGLDTAQPPKGRLTRIEFGEHLLIDDTYNANPTSILAAAQVLTSEDKQKILILGDIAELGEAAIDEHQVLGTGLAGFAIDKILTIGTLMRHCSDATNQLRPDFSVHFNDKQALLGYLNDLLKQPSCVLFKGSRSMRMETLIDDLTHSTQQSE